MYLIVEKSKHGNANVWILIFSWVLAQCSLVNANWKIILKSMKKKPFNTALKKIIMMFGSKLVFITYIASLNCIFHA